MADDLQPFEELGQVPQKPRPFMKDRKEREQVNLRLEKIYESALLARDYGVALKALDRLARLRGINL